MATLTALHASWLKDLGDPDGTRFTDAQYFYDAYNSAQKWLVPIAPYHLLEDLQTSETQTITGALKTSWDIPASYAGYPSLELNGIPAILYVSADLSILKNDYYASSATNPKWTVRNSKYEILHTTTEGDEVVFYFVKNGTEISALSGSGEIPIVLQDILLKKAVAHTLYSDNREQEAINKEKEAQADLDKLLGGGKS